MMTSYFNFAGYNCHGGWEELDGQENKLNYFVVSPQSRSSKSPRRLCALLVTNRESEFNRTNESVKLIASRDRCPSYPSSTKQNWNLNLDRISN